MVSAQLHARWPWVVGATMLLALAAQACDTPVYEYTLRYWQRDPYRVCYLYRGAEAAEDAAVNSRLEQMAKTHANIMFARIDGATIDTSARGSLAQYVWERHGSETLPLHVVLTPRGVDVFSGRLDVAAIEGIAKSPKRTEMVKQLCEGKHGVLVLLKGPLAEGNATAEKAVRAVLASAKEEEVEVGLVVVRRDDPKEKWLVRQLLTLEPDLKDLKNAMVFAAFGRGHVLEPYLGKGITEMNLAEVIWFMNGPCACEIKMAAPGMDLLTDWDWDKHAAALPPPQWGPMEFGIIDVEEATPPAPAEEPAAPDGSATPEEPEPSEAAPAREEKGSADVKKAELIPESPEIEERAVAPAEAAGIEEKPFAPPPAEERPEATRDPTEIARAPVLPKRAVAAEGPQAEVDEKASFASALGQRLGLVLGGGAIVVLLVGIVLLKTRKES